MKIARLLLRLGLGGLFVGHGTQKLFGWFGGHGLEGTSQFFEMLGLRPGRHHATAAGAAEAGGGALMVLGLFTPLAASLLTGTMLTAINRVHLKNGPWIADQGYEYNLVVILAALTLAEVGPGRPSLDAAMGDKLHGSGWAIFALAGGAAGAAGAHLYASSQPESEPAGVAEPQGPEAGAVTQPQATA